METITKNEGALSALKERISANVFEKGAVVSDAEIRELVGYAAQAPSSINIQPWRFIAVRDAASKEKLKAVAYNQPKITDASVIFIVLGDLKGYEKLSLAVKPMIANGQVDAATAERWVAMANGAYSNDPQKQRDEAFRGGSMAAMNLMTAAQALGLASCPMGGFDAAGVKREFGISERFLPVLLIAVGRPGKGDFAKKPRFSVDDILSFEKGREFLS